MKPYMIRLSILIVLVLLVGLPTAHLAQGQTGGEGEIITSQGEATTHRSDSPYLQLPEKYRNYPPIESPKPNIVEGVVDQVVSFDPLTREETLLPASSLEAGGIEQFMQTEPFSGLLPEIGSQIDAGSLESVFPPDDRVRVSNTGDYPWRTIVQLYIDWPDGGGGGCSGAIIGCSVHGYMVLTAGHCVYSHDHGGWAVGITVVPGQDESYMPYYLAHHTQLWSYTGWTVDANTQHDIGYIELDRNIGDFTGWMGRMTADPTDSVYTGVLNTAGYPCSVYSASCPYPITPDGTQWYDWDYGRTADEYNHWHWMDTMPGQSGSPVWRIESGNRFILTVHTTGNDGSGSNHGTRLNNGKYNDILNLCSSEAPPTDYPDLLDDGQAWSGFSPIEVRPGHTSFHVWSDTRNTGTASSGAFTISYRASLNSTISTGDPLIGSDAMGSINPFTWADSDLPVTFPAGIADGLYYVGWLIDSPNVVAEFDENNNIAYKTGYRLLVDGTPPTNPNLVFSPSHTPGVLTDHRYVVVNWSGASDLGGTGVSGYSILWDLNPLTIPNAVMNSTGSNATSPELPNGNWYFHIRTVDGVGNWASNAVHLGPFKIASTVFLPITIK